MVAILTKHWWAIATRGVLAIVFGALTMVWPMLTLQALVLLFGAYATVDGLLALVAGVQRQERGERARAMLFEGLAGIGVGTVVFLWPAVPALVLFYLIALWAIATGVFELAVALRLRRQMRGAVFLAIAGAASLMLGALIVLFPNVGVLALGWMIGGYAVLFGVLLVGLGLRLRALRQPGSGDDSSPEADRGRFIEILRF